VKAQKYSLLVPKGNSCVFTRVCLGMTVMHWNYIQEEIAGRLDSGTAYFRSGSCVCLLPGTEEVKYNEL
jgi:hypothetical protein